MFNRMLSVGFVRKAALQRWRRLGYNPEFYPDFDAATPELVVYHHHPYLLVNGSLYVSTIFGHWQFIDDIKLKGVESELLAGKSRQQQEKLLKPLALAGSMKKYDMVPDVSEPIFVGFTNGEVGNQHNLQVYHNHLFVLLHFNDINVGYQRLVLYNVEQKNGKSHLIQDGSTLKKAISHQLEGPFSDGLYFKNKQPCLSVGYTIKTDQEYHQHPIRYIFNAMRLKSPYRKLSLNCLNDLFGSQKMKYWHSVRYGNFIPTNKISSVKLIHQPY